MGEYNYVPRVTEEQLVLGKRLGLDLSQDTKAVAAARILDVVGSAIGDVPRYDKPTDKQIAFAESLGIDVTKCSFRVAFAMIQDACLEQEKKAVERMSLKPGDKVLRERELERDGQVYTLKREYIVSSIRDDGFVYFKGIGCECGWASTLRKIED